MKYLLLFLSLLLIGFTKVNSHQQKYLPVYLSLLDTAFIPSVIPLNIKAAFGLRKIKILGKKDVESIIHNEITSVTLDYVRTGGDMADFEKLKTYQSSNVRSVGNSLTLSIKIDANGFINDTVKWDNHTIPINMINFHKPRWHYIILDSTNTKSLLQMSQSLVDSIIASNVLVKE
jgi:hypothetical protein